MASENGLDDAREYLRKLRNRRQQTTGRYPMFVDTGFTLGLNEAENASVPPSELMLYLHNYRMRPGETAEMQRLDMYEDLMRTATIDDIAILKALISERLRED